MSQPVCGDFIAGPENRLVGYAAEGIRSRQAACPVVFFGPRGVGKSHLAMGLFEKPDGPTRSDGHTKDEPLFLFAEDLPRDRRPGVSLADLLALRRRRRQARTLVIENLHYLRGHDAAQRDVVALLDCLRDRGERVIVTLLEPPQSTLGLIPTLRSRLLAGLLVGVNPPGRAARREMLKQFSRDIGAPLTDEALDWLAARIDGPAPKLRAAVMRVAAERRLKETHGGTIGLHAVKEWLGGAGPNVTLAQIARQTARSFGVKLADLRGPSRRQGLVAARGLAMYLARRMTGESLQRIGHYFGGRDHTTVLHNCRRTEAALPGDPLLRQALSELEEAL